MSPISRIEHRGIYTKYLVRKTVSKLLSKAQSTNDTKHPGGGGRRGRISTCPGHRPLAGAFYEASFFILLRSLLWVWHTTLLVPTLCTHAKACFLSPEQNLGGCTLNTANSAVLLCPFTCFLNNTMATLSHENHIVKAHFWYILTDILYIFLNQTMVIFFSTCTSKDESDPCLQKLLWQDLWDCG